MFDEVLKKEKMKKMVMLALCSFYLMSQAGASPDFSSGVLLRACQAHSPLLPWSQPRLNYRRYTIQRQPRNVSNCR
jgi:hypothetical protein